MSEVQTAADETANTSTAPNESNAETHAVVIVEKEEKLLSVKQGKSILKKLETTIAQGIKDFWTVGEALARIREEGLFRLRYSGEDYRTFGDYLEDRWGYSRGYQLLKAAKIRRTMIDMGIKNPDAVCTSERQYRENAGLLLVAADEKKLGKLKNAIKGEKRLTNEIFAKELRKLLPEPKEKKPKTASKGSLEKSLAKLRKGLEAELRELRAQHPEQLEVIAAWVGELASL